MRNLEILSFIDQKQIKIQFKFLKDYFNDYNEKKFMLYYENFWLKKDYDLFNYSEIIKDILKIENKYIISKGSESNKKLLFSKVTSINKLFFTNNICENIHSKISKNIPNGQINKYNLKQTLKYILNSYELNNKEIVRKDFITRTLIIIVEKLNLNTKPQIITYDVFKKELEYTISIMTGKTNLNSVKELLNVVDYENQPEEIEENSENNDMDISDDEDEDKSNDGNSSNIEGDDGIQDSNLIKKNEKIKFLDNLDIDLSKEANLSLDSSYNKNNQVEENDIDMYDDSKINQNSEYNINDLKKERKNLNIFTLDFNCQKNDLNSILLD